MDIPARSWLSVSLAVGLVLIAGGGALGMPMHDGGVPRARPASPPSVPITTVPSIQALTVAGETIYAGSFGMGVFRSDDRGDTWTAVNDGMRDPFVLCLATAPDGSVYAGTFRGGVYESRDGGKSWQAVNTGLKRLEIKALLIHADTIYAGTGDGLYRRPLRGTEWSAVGKGLDDILVHSIAILPDRALYVGTSGRGIYRYDNTPHGRTWTRLSRGLKDHEGLIENFIRVIAVDRDQGLYAGTFDGGVFYSHDGGATWRPISRALPNDSIRGILPSERGLFVATGRGVYKTDDRGGRWEARNQGLTEQSVQVLVASASGSLYAGTSAGVFRSDDDGQSWVGVSKGMEGEGRPPF